MNWSDVAEVVGKAAPVAGAVLGGPAGASLGQSIASALGVASTPEAVNRELMNNPESFVRLREIESNLEAELIQGRTKVVQAEVQGESWLQRNWRPLLMLWFATLIGAHWFGFTAENLDQSTIELVLTIIQYGMTGYIVGRTAEKVVTSASGNGLMERIKTVTKK